MQRQSNPRKSGVQPERPRSASTSNSSPVAGPSRPSRSTSNTIPDGTSDMQVDIPDAAEEDTQYLPKKSFVTTKGWTMEGLVERAPHFRPIPRVAAQDPRLHEIINQHEIDGVPLIIEGWHHHKKWPKELFQLEWLREHGDPNAFARNVHTWADLKLPLPDLIDKLRASPQFATPDEKERLYGKDGECPQKWKNWLIRDRVIPSRFLFDGEDDFLQHLPEANKVETLMCYLGVGDTFTPFHKDLCASSGQNLMCYTEGSGSSFWFMTKGSDAARVADYFHELGQELDLESHVVTVGELERAPFGVYVAEQTLGDLVLVPPRSCHQVINHGGITIKTSWSRMTLAGLRTALYHELPIYRRVCRPEIYRVKSNIYHALIHYTTELEKFVVSSVSTSSRASLAADDEDHWSNARQLRQLLELFDDIIAEEYTPIHSRLPHVSQLGSHKDDINCDFCGADVFQSFFGCEACVERSAADSVTSTTNVGDGIVICSSCYVEGRTCLCGAMRPAQCRPFSELLRHRDRAMKALENSGVEKNQEYIYFSSKKSQLLCVGNLNIFHAGCILQQTRCSMKDGSQIRSCRSKSTHPSHVAIASSVILCKGCHSGRCFSHVLEMNFVHSAEAILLSRADASDQRWHQHHKQSKAKFEVAQPQILRDEEEAVRPDMRHKLVHLALNFRTSTAVNPRLTKHGWYDEYLQLPSIPIMTNPPKLKKLANIPDTAEFSPQTSTHEPRPDMQTHDHSSSPYDRESSPLTSIDSDDDDEADDDANADMVVNRGSLAMTPTISGPSKAGIVHKVIMDRATKGKKVFVLVPGGGRDNWPSRPDKPQARAPSSTQGDTEPAGSDGDQPTCQQRPSKPQSVGLGKRSRRIVVSPERDDSDDNNADIIAAFPPATRASKRPRKKARFDSTPLTPRKSTRLSSQAQSQSLARANSPLVDTPQISVADALQQTFNNNAYSPTDPVVSRRSILPFAKNPSLRTLNRIETYKARIRGYEARIKSLELRHKSAEARHRLDEERHKLDEALHDEDQRIIQELMRALASMGASLELGHEMRPPDEGADIGSQGSPSREPETTDNYNEAGPSSSAINGAPTTFVRRSPWKSQHPLPPPWPTYYRKSNRFSHAWEARTNRKNLGSGPSLLSRLSDYHIPSRPNILAEAPPRHSSEHTHLPSPPSEEIRERTQISQDEEEVSQGPDSRTLHEDQEDHAADSSQLVSPGSPQRLSTPPRTDHSEGGAGVPDQSALSESEERDEDEVSIGGSSDMGEYYAGT